MKFSLGIKLNKVAKYLILSDLIFYTGWGLISPVFAIFIVNLIKGGNAGVVGIAAAINLIVRSLLRVPFGMLADEDGKKKAYNCMLYGLLVSAFVPIGYIFARLPWHIYVLQGLLGTTMAMTTAGWTGIFSRYMDKGKESTEWGVDAVAVGVGPGIAAVIGGFAVTYFSFNYVFIAVTLVGLIGVLVLLVVKKDILNRPIISQGRLFTHREVRRLKKRMHH